MLHTVSRQIPGDMSRIYFKIFKGSFESANFPKPERRKILHDDRKRYKV